MIVLKKARHNINAYEAVALQTDAYLTSVLQSGDWLDSNPATFCCLTYWTRGWVGSKLGLQPLRKRTLLYFSVIEQWFLASSARSLVSIATQIFQLNKKNDCWIKNWKWAGQKELWKTLNKPLYPSNTTYIFVVLNPATCTLCGFQ